MPRRISAIGPSAARPRGSLTIGARRADGWIVVDGGSGSDPFDDLVLDESFVAGARKREDSADERHARARRAADAARALDEQHEAEAKRSRKRRRRGRRRTVVGIIGVVALVATVGVVSLRLRSTQATSTGSVNDLLSLHLGVGSGRPSRMPPASDAPLGTPAPTNSATGSHVFLEKGADGEPARYNPCRPIPIVVNNRRTAVGGPAALDAALAEMTEITGLHFVEEGSTDEVPTPDREAYQPERYGDRWAPVLVAWTDPAETPVLDGRIAGVGGSSVLPAGDAAVNVTGIVYLDGPSFEEIRTRADGLAQMKAIILHELGHLVGLDHVSVPSELMFSDNNGLTDFGPGDREGLAILGAGPCVDP